MPYWHDTKKENYHSLCSAIRSNGWKVSFFAVEVGVRGYCAESLLSCLRCLGLPSKLCGSTIKNLSSVSLKCSFDIWMARNSCNWKLETSYPSNFHQVNSLSPSSVTVVQPKPWKVPSTPSSTRTVFETNSPKVPAADTVQKLRKHVHLIYTDTKLISHNENTLISNGLHLLSFFLEIKETFIVSDQLLHVFFP